MLVENRDFFLTPLAFDTAIRGEGSRRNIATPFGVEKLEWWGYPTVKNFEDMCNRLGTIPACDRRTGRWRCLRTQTLTGCLQLRSISLNRTTHLQLLWKTSPVWPLIMACHILYGRP